MIPCQKGNHFKKNCVEETVDLKTVDLKSLRSVKVSQVWVNSQVGQRKTQVKSQVTYFYIIIYL